MAGGWQTLTLATVWSLNSTKKNVTYDRHNIPTVTGSKNFVPFSEMTHSISLPTNLVDRFWPPIRPQPQAFSFAWKQPCDPWSVNGSLSSPAWSGGAKSNWLILEQRREPRTGVSCHNLCRVSWNSRLHLSNCMLELRSCLKTCNLSAWWGKTLSY